MTVVPVLPANAQLEVTPKRVTIKAGETLPESAFVVSAVDDEQHESDRSMQLTWRIETADAPYAKAALPATKLVVVDDDPVAPKREPRETAPVTKPEQPAPVAPLPSTPTPPVDRAPVPIAQPATPTPQPQVQQPAPVAEPRQPEPEPRAKPAPEVEQGGLAKFGAWAKDHKTAVVSTSVVGLALAKILGVLHSMPGGLGRLFGQRQIMGRAADELRKRRSMLRNGDPIRRRRRGRGADEPQDILDELETKYEGNYEDPLRNFERRPGADRPDPLRDLESRLDGFDLDDAA